MGSHLKTVICITKQFNRLHHSNMHKYWIIFWEQTVRYSPHSRVNGICRFVYTFWRIIKLHFQINSVNVSHLQNDNKYLAYWKCIDTCRYIPNICIFMHNFVSRRYNFISNISNVFGNPKSLAGKDFVNFINWSALIRLYLRCEVFFSCHTQKCLCF